MPWIILGLCISYLIGSIPTAYIFVRLLKGQDIRTIGSGNVGATNALRVLGKPLGVTILILDILKGFAAVALVGDWVAAHGAALSPEPLRILLGLACVSGHNWTVFLRFKGGKGIATSFGSLLGLACKIPGLWLVLGLVVLVWLAAFLASRIVSLSSVLAGISLPVFAALLRQSQVLTAASLVLALFIVVRHRSNLKRIFQKQERPLF
ncbi:MAG TPA: glycerol-3-phosphate 1-O-acyltransferase PlsY [Patescibacteria group bacterium]|nr:glycerol-3-phosphate 1-O-acyltransferase PlsY [Patescibacteria group bacterium]